MKEELQKVIEQVRTNSKCKKICKGNPHNCVKTKYHRAASRSDKQINDDVLRRR